MSINNWDGKVTPKVGQMVQVNSMQFEFSASGIGVHCLKDSYGALYMVPYSQIKPITDHKQSTIANNKAFAGMVYNLGCQKVKSTKSDPVNNPTHYKKCI